MKKKPSVFLTILSILMIIGAVECLVFSLLYQESPDQVGTITEIEISQAKASSKMYLEELEVLERYAFQTIYEYEDSEGIYSDVTYYVYEDSHPMDRNQLFGEYYIVKFRDKTGTEYITSLSVSAYRSVAPLLAEAPVTIPACVGVRPIENRYPENSNDRELYVLQEAALDAYAQESGISRAPVTFGYLDDTIAEYQQAFEQDVASAKITALVFGLILGAGGVLLLVLPRKKKAK